jgi:hypothetical protein
MNTWYKVTLSKQDIIEGKHISLVLESHRLYMANRAPKDFAVFTNDWHDFPIEYFFSPEAALISTKLIASYGGVECAAPLASDVLRSVGDMRHLDKIPFATS